MTYFLSLRLKQIFRIFLEIGLLRALLLIILFGIAVFKLIIFTTDHSALISVISFLSVLSIHFTRKDKKILGSVFDRPTLIYFIEYTVITIPGLLALAYGQSWIEFFSLLTGIVILSLNNSQSVSLNTTIKGIQVLPNLPIEWLCGLRKNWPGLVILYAVSVFSYSYSTAIPLLLIVSTIIVASFFNECEPYQLIDLYRCSSNSFLRSKYIQHLKVFWLLYAPLLLLYFVLFPDYWFVPLILITICSTIIILAINTKYASYEPNEILGMNSIIIIISTCCFLIPFLSPIPFFLLIRNHRRAVKNLETYLYAFH